MKTFQVNLQLTVVMSKYIKAVSMEEALKLANEMANREEGVKAAKGWEYQWCEKSEVQGVSQ